MVRTRGKRLVAFALAAITAVLLCSACAQQQPDENAEEEMSRGIQAPPAFELVLVPANAEGSYTVTIGEANVTEDQQYAEDIPEVVTAEEARALEPDAEGTTSPGTDEGDSTTAASDSDGASEGQQTAEDNPEIVTVEEDASEPEAVEVVGEPAAEDNPEILTVEEDASEPEAVEVVGEPAAEDNPEIVTVEEDASEPEAVEVVGEPAVEAEEEMTRSVGDDGRWSLGNVKQEDVTVCYNVILSGDDGTTTSEVREAEVTGLTNNGDSIELSFTLSSGNDQAPDTYTVHFANTDRYAVVVVAQEANDFEVTAVDYEGQITEELQNVDVGFTAADVALPEGTYIEDGQLIVTEDAPDVVQEVLVESGIAEEEATRDALEEDLGKNEDKSAGKSEDANASGSNGSSSDASVEYMKEVNARQKRFKNYDAAADYTVEVLDYVDPTYGKVAQFGSDSYSIFKGIYTGDVGSFLKGSMGILKMFGLFKKKSASPVPTVSNEQILSEVQKVGIEVVNVHELVAAMNDTVNITKQELYSQGVEAYDNALIALEGDAEILQNMLTQGAIAAAQEGIEPPEEDCDAEEEFEYNWQLINYIKEQEQKKSRKSQKFAGFTGYAEDLGKNFTLVAGATAKPPNTNPVKKYDKYWNTYFNYETQGYYLRQAYRSNIEYQLKRAFGILEIYHNIFDPEAGGVKLSYNNQFCSALESLEQMPAGTSPEDINTHKSFRVYCPTFDCDVTQISVQRFAKGNKVVDEALLEYANRLHGRTIEEDFKLAGLWGDGRDPGDSKMLLQWYNPPWEELGPTDYARQYHREENYRLGGHGIGFNCKDKDGNGHYVADIVSYDGQVFKEQPTFNCQTWESFKPHDLPKEGGPYDVSEMRYIFLGLAAHTAG